jgi:hypothetical protein
MQLFTITMLASFFTWKLLNGIYENIYEPMIDTIIPDEECEKHTMLINNHRMRIGFLFKELVKYLVLIIFLMIIYNIIVSNHLRKN